MGVSKFGKTSFIPCLYFYGELTVAYGNAPTVIDACGLCLGVNLSTRRERFRAEKRSAQFFCAYPFAGASDP